MPLRNLFIVRVALMTGVFLFAALAYFGPQVGIAASFDLGESLGSLRWVARTFFVIAIVVAVLLRPKLEGAEPSRIAQLLIIGWAVGEAAALMGVVTYMGGGGLAPLALGLMAFVFALVMLPIPRPRR